MAYLDECAGEAAMPRQMPEDELLSEELGKRREISKRIVEDSKRTLRIHQAVLRACDVALKELDAGRDLPDGAEQIKKAML